MHQLRITVGPGAGRVLALNPAYSYSLGRDPQAHLSVPEDQTLSRTHAEFVPQGGAWLLRNKSQHGSLVNGQVVHGDTPIPVGATFQIGAITVIFEALGEAGAAAAAMPPPPVAAGGAPLPPTVPPAMPGQPQGMPGQPQGMPGQQQQPAAADPFGSGGVPAGTAGAAPGEPGGQPAAAGQPAGGGKGGMGGDAAAGFAAGGAAFGAAAASLAEGAGPVSIEHEGPGYPFMDLAKGGFAIVKGNLIPSLALSAPTLLVIIVQVLMATVIPTSLLGIFSLVFLAIMLIVSLVMPQVTCNYLAAVKEYQATGRNISIGDLLKFNDLVQRYITLFIVGVACCFCYVPGMILCMAVPLIVDRPEVGFMNAVKGALAFGKRNLVPNILLCIVGGIVYMIGALACGLGVFVTMPTMLCYFWLAYALKKDEITAAAKEDGIELA